MEFKSGMRIRCVNPKGRLEKNKVYTIERIIEEPRETMKTFVNIKEIPYSKFFFSRFIFADIPHLKEWA